MAYEYKNNEIENNKLLDEIKSKLNASPSNFLDVQLINEIANDLWNKTNKNEDRCIFIINRLSSRIKKTQDFKLKSKDFLYKLSKNSDASENLTNENKKNIYADFLKSDDAFVIILTRIGYFILPLFIILIIFDVDMNDGLEIINAPFKFFGTFGDIVFWLLMFCIMVGSFLYVPLHLIFKLNKMIKKNKN